MIRIVDLVPVKRCKRFARLALCRNLCVTDLIGCQRGNYLILTKKERKKKVDRTVVPGRRVNGVSNLSIARPVGCGLIMLRSNGWPLIGEKQRTAAPRDSSNAA